MTSLTGKIAFVTGGSRGIGAAIVRRLAADGATVAFTYVSAHDRALQLAAGIDAVGGRALPVRADSADAQALQRAIAGVATQFGRIDILVNSAGILVHKDLAETTLEDYDRIAAVNVRALFVATQAAAPHMGQGGGGVAARATDGAVQKHQHGAGGSPREGRETSASVARESTPWMTPDFSRKGRVPHRCL